MAYEFAKYEVSQRVATITLNRPEVLNALNPQMSAELMGALQDAGADDEVRCVILTGAGRAFCAGADLKRRKMEFEDRDRAAEQPSDPVGPEYERTTLSDVIWRMTKPVIAAINGVAAGGGAAITLPCDIRVASEAARLGFLWVKRGVVPELGSTFILPRLVGHGRAKELCLTGRLVEAGEAKAIGLVNEVYSAGELMPRTLELARSIAAHPPIAVKFIKRGLNLSLDSTHRDMIQFEHWALFTCRRSEDYREAIRAFVEKRDAVFKGR